MDFLTRNLQIESKKTLANISERVVLCNFKQRKCKLQDRKSIWLRQKTEFSLYFAKEIEDYIERNGMHHFLEKGGGDVNGSLVLPIPYRSAQT